MKDALDKRDASVLTKLGSLNNKDFNTLVAIFRNERDKATRSSGSNGIHCKQHNYETTTTTTKAYRNLPPLFFITSASIND